MTRIEKLRTFKILTESDLDEIIRGLSPCFIKKFDTEVAGDPQITAIIDQTGLCTCHYLLNDLLSNTYKSYTDGLPEPTVLPVGRVYTISYEDPNGGEVPNQKIVQAITGSNYELKSDDLPKLPNTEELSFDGWMLNGRKLNPGDIISTNVVLTATWKDLVFILNYANGELGPSTFSPSIPSSKEVTPEEGLYTLTEEDLPELSTEEDWDFVGWFNGETKVEPGDEISDDANLVARWEYRGIVLDYKVDPRYPEMTFTPSIPSTKYIESDSYILTEDDVPTLTPTGLYSDYVFNGWLSPDYSIQYHIGDEITESAILVAGFSNGK